MTEDAVQEKRHMAATPPSGMKVAVLVAILAIFACLFAFGSSPEISDRFVVPTPPTPVAAQTPMFEQRFVCSGETEFAHSVAVVHLGEGHLRAFWNGGGSREGLPDVNIYTAVYDPPTRTWSPQEALITRATVRDALARNVITLGNPVVRRSDAGRLMLWFVSVSVGGWSGSAINFVTSDDDGRTWTSPARLITTPFFNLATLVKGPAITFEDGSIGLPVYHECIGKFAELLRLEPDGRLRHKQRLTFGRRLLQPTIVPVSPDEATCFLRRAGSAPRRGITISTEDGAVTWSKPRFLKMKNSGAPIGATRLASGELLLAFNDHLHSRRTLTLALTDDEGETHTIIMADTEEGEDKDQFKYGLSYPVFVRDEAGEFHLFYTWHRQRIRHLRFNQAWLDERR